MEESLKKNLKKASKRITNVFFIYIETSAVLLFFFFFFFLIIWPNRVLEAFETEQKEEEGTKTPR